MGGNLHSWEFLLACRPFSLLCFSNGKWKGLAGADDVLLLNRCDRLCALCLDHGRRGPTPRSNVRHRDYIAIRTFQCCAAMLCSNSVLFLITDVYRPPIMSPHLSLSSLLTLAPSHEPKSVCVLVTLNRSSFVSFSSPVISVWVVSTRFSVSASSRLYSPSTSLVTRSLTFSKSPFLSSLSLSFFRIFKTPSNATDRTRDTGRITCTFMLCGICEPSLLAGEGNVSLMRSGSSTGVTAQLLALPCESRSQQQCTAAIVTPLCQEQPNMEAG